ncbi:hypothetical protein GUITHDRAFT_119876 [Guillardia theta CCMP2712]|uniref:Uncharacterized protein n=1 Tax=Guillardia theta (strain CCMP2712) TaxID=905079 RepID=L1IDP7_GUITC|nr:hypothetical protein GUITHDRAFT_119876 [Guillardia theta CCMP2712]EKX33950.1 hypothetical protein GUITHDRAFT_119876 [Guillardia theta CCMP2712]|eukprot:XP_005820930.1 hypothetical protein GUITHDRAFT_119876 [Guillardia theta CCMP2712]
MNKGYASRRFTISIIILLPPVSAEPAKKISADNHMNPQSRSAQGSLSRNESISSPVVPPSSIPLQQDHKVNHPANTIDDACEHRANPSVKVSSISKTANTPQTSAATAAPRNETVRQKSKGNATAVQLQSSGTSHDKRDTSAMDAGNSSGDFRLQEEARPLLESLNAGSHDLKLPANKSRYQFPVEALIDGAKQGEAKQDDVTKEIEEIESSLKAELAANPSNITNIMEFFHFMRLVLEDEEAVSKTNASFSSALAVAPNDPLVALVYGNFLFEVLHDAVAAEEMYKRALLVDPNHVLVLGNLAALHHTVNDNLDRAEELYQRAVGWAPSAPGYFTVEYHDLRNSTGLLPSRLEYAAVLYNFGALLHDGRRDLQLAKAMYNLALQYDPHKSELLNNMGSVLAQLKEYEAAESMYRRAMTSRNAEENMVTTCHNFGILQAERGRIDKAAELLNKALQLDPFHIPTCLTYGRLLLETKMDTDGRSCPFRAERMYKRALRRNPGQIHALVGFAQVCEVKGDVEMAEEFYARATDFHEDNMDALIHKGLFHELSRKEIRQADVLYSRAQELDSVRARERYDLLLPRHQKIVSLALKYRSMKSREEGLSKHQSVGSFLGRFLHYRPPLLSACFGLAAPESRDSERARSSSGDSRKQPNQEEATTLGSVMAAAERLLARVKAFLGTPQDFVSSTLEHEEEKDAGAASSDRPSAATDVSPKLRSSEATVEELRDGRGQGGKEGPAEISAQSRCESSLDVLYNTDFDERVARARSWDEIREVTKEYLRGTKASDIKGAFRGDPNMEEELEEPDLLADDHGQLEENEHVEAVAEQQKKSRTADEEGGKRQETSGVEGKTTEEQEEKAKPDANAEDAKRMEKEGTQADIRNFTTNV